MDCNSVLPCDAMVWAGGCFRTLSYGFELHNANVLLCLAPTTRPRRVYDADSLPMDATSGFPKTSSCTLESRSASSLHFVDGRAAYDASPSVARACDANPSFHSSTRRCSLVTRRMQCREDVSEATTTTSFTRVEVSVEGHGCVGGVKFP